MTRYTVVSFTCNRPEGTGGINPGVSMLIW